MSEMFQRSDWKKQKQISTKIARESNKINAVEKNALKFVWHN